jgi:hypothetical protein
MQYILGDSSLRTNVADDCSLRINVADDSSLQTKCSGYVLYNQPLNVASTCQFLVDCSTIEQASGMVSAGVFCEVENRNCVEIYTLQLIST